MSYNEAVKVQADGMKWACADGGHAFKDVPYANFAPKCPDCPATQFIAIEEVIHRLARTPVDSAA